MKPGLRAYTYSRGIDGPEFPPIVDTLKALHSTGEVAVVHFPGEGDAKVSVEELDAHISPTQTILVFGVAYHA